MKTLEELMYKTIEEFEGSGTLEMYTEPIELKKTIFNFEGQNAPNMESVVIDKEHKATIKVYDELSPEGLSGKYFLSGQGFGVSHKDELKSKK